MPALADFRRPAWVALALLGSASVAPADSIIRVLHTNHIEVAIKTSAVPGPNGHFAANDTGLLEIVHDKHNYLWKQVDLQTNNVKVPLANVTVSPSTVPSSGGNTYFAVTGGHFNLTKDTKLKVKKAGVTLLIPQNTDIILSTQDKVVINMAGSGPQPSATPVAGSQVTVSTLEIGKKGVAAEGTLQMVDADLPGVSVANGTFKWKLDATSEDDCDSLFSLEQSSPASFNISVDLPGIAGSQSNPVTLKVTNFRLNGDNDATYDGTVVAPTAGIRIPLANPANFAIIIYRGTMSMVEGSVTSASIDAGVELPPDFFGSGTAACVIPVNLQVDDGTTETPDLLADDWPTPKHIGLQLVNERPVVSSTRFGGLQVALGQKSYAIDLANNDSIDASIAQPSILLKKKGLKLVKKGPVAVSTKFGGFQLTLAKNEYVIDLDKNNSIDASYLSGAPTSPALKPEWMGIVIKKGKLTFPSEFGDGSDVEVHNVLIGPGGMNGTFAANNFKVPYFTNSKLDTFSGTFLQGKLTECLGQGTIHITDLKTDVAVKVAATSSGAFNVTAKQGQAIPMSAFGGKVSMQIDHGTFAYDKTKKTGCLSLAGSLSFADSVPDIGGTKLGFEKLSVSSAGKLSISGGFVDLPNPVKVPLGPVAVTLEQFGLTTYEDGAYSTPALKLTGAVSVSDDLPVNGSVGFDGISIFQDQANKLQVDWESISLDLDIDKVGSLHAELEKGEFPDSDYTTFLQTHSSASPWRNAAPVTWLAGEGTLTLDCLKGGPVKIDFVSAPKAWYVSLDVPLSSSGVKLGNSGLALFGIQGGLGRNITSYTGDAGMVGVPQVDYKLIPIPADLAPGTPNWDKKWLFKAGVTIGTDDAFTVWGDAVLTASLGTSSFFIDLDGKFYILSKMEAATRQSPDRFAHVNLHYDSPSETFTARASADLYFPTRAKGFVHASAPIELMISPNAKHVYVGENIIQNPGHRPTMTSPAILSVGPLSGEGVFMVDFPNASGGYKLKAGGVVGGTLTFDADFNWCELSGGLSADAYFYCDASLLAATNTHGLQFNGAHGEVGLDASIWGDARIGKKKWAFLASGHADMSAYLDTDYHLSGTGVLDGHLAFGRFHSGFSKQFSF